MSTPHWALTAAYWLHMLATVLWLGGLSSTAILILPAARKSLPADLYHQLLDQIQKKLQMIGWLSLAVLWGTGMFQMSANPEYGGVLAIENNWAVAIFLKHLVVLIMMAASAYMTWGILPALSRLALIKAAGKAVDEKTEVRLRQKEARLIWANLILSFVVLLLTAAARAG